MNRGYVSAPASSNKTGRRAGQRGVALITALLIVSLATVAAVAMATRQHLDMRRSANLLQGEQAYAYALAAESWAQVIMDADLEDSEIDTLNEGWATALPPISVEGGFVSGRISDLQGRYNVNNLVDENGVSNAAEMDYFGRLLQVLGLEPALAVAVADWIDGDIDAIYPDGAEDDSYLLMDPPYRAANRPLNSISELRLVKGFDAAALSALGRYITALPVSTGINVNTASAEVLLALDEDLLRTDVESLITDRGEEGFEDEASFLAHDAMAGLQIDVAIGTQSDWFSVHTDVLVGRGKARLESLLSREGEASRIVSRVRTRQQLLP